MVPAAALIPVFWPPAPSFAAPGVGCTLIRARDLRHHMSPRPQTFPHRALHRLRPATAFGIENSDPISGLAVGSGCTTVQGGEGAGGGRRRRLRARRSAATAAVTC